MIVRVTSKPPIVKIVGNSKSSLTLAGAHMTSLTTSHSEAAKITCANWVPFLCLW
jgi:hypothetical protein